ncbi:MAG TPA: transketolase [Oleiagrimonas sp.]|nr:transketolase [Oleiagrimonas sp.]
MPSRRELANAIRALAMDSVEKANSGHPGMPMGMADIAEVLWNDFHQHNPGNPNWFNRDRFVLSNGHGSMLQYALLHLTGYDLPMDELKRFRQWHSRTPGHPEAADTVGIETTTGPLGQGIANGVGFALAEKILAGHFNKPDFDIVDHHTWVFCGDGCLMEGISQEAISLAGTWKLGKLTLIYDDNNISIDGEVPEWFTDDTGKRFEACDWHVIRDVDGQDAEAVKKALAEAVAETGKPTLMMCKTTIGFGAPNKGGTAKAHGSALGADEIAAARKQLGWEYAPFEIPDDIYAAYDAHEAGEQRESAWNALVEKYAAAHPELAAEFRRRESGELPDNWDQVTSDFIAKTQAEGPEVASRKASQMTLNAYGPLLPELVGGSADLAPSNLTIWDGSNSIMGGGPDGNYIHYGVREFGMTAIGTGLALHGGLIPYDATFMTFCDYSRNAVRMSCLIPAHSIHVFTHDSIGVGEDGPTHQPVEHLAGLRYIPGNHVWRPCDAVESAVSWKWAIEHKLGPSCLVFSRQKLDHQPRTAEQVTDIRRGGYVLHDPADGKFDAILIATGSEVGLAMDTMRHLDNNGIAVRVVSMPCTEIFDAQSAEYREGVLPGHCRARVAIEAATADFWGKYVGLDGAVVGMTSFGASAPGPECFEHFGFTVAHVADAVHKVID